jgi:putative hydrolase of the HAD superfamily
VSGRAADVGAVLWDADGVLQRAPGGREETMRPAVEGRVEDVDGFLAEAVREERHALIGEVRWADVLPRLLERWGIPDALDDLFDAWLTIEPVAESRDVVRRLRDAGIGCYLATNQDEQRASYMQRALGYDELLDGAFYSHVLGAAKPDRPFFDAVLDRLGLPPERVLLVDDNSDYVDAAREVGMPAVLWRADDGVDVLLERLAANGLPVA